MGFAFQCCAEGSPSARTKTGWPGGLRQGDEILCISGKYVKKLTRAECIRALKESPVYVKMRIRHYFPNNNSAGYQLAAKAKVLSHFIPSHPKWHRSTMHI